MASSSSHQPKHDVFLSFSGEDTRNSFTNKLKLWKDAFTEAGYIKGWHIVGDKSDRSEPEYIEEIVQDIVKKLDCMSVSDSKGSVGIDHHKDQIIRYLLAIDEKETPIKGIGIWGMGGVGKTTPAQAIYDEIHGEFDSCCFLANVTEESKKHDGIISLRDKLFSVILEDESLRTGTPSIGSTFLSERLGRKRVLVVLDDVSDLEQLEILAVGPDRFGYGSRSIITSRDKQKGIILFGCMICYKKWGWNIVRQESKDPGERSRLWTHKDVSRVLKHDTGTKSVEGIFLDMYGIDEIQLHQDVFAKMRNLRLVKFYYSQFSGKEGLSLRL
ncbi:hypothetical protein PTKIN_Ptkin12aG0029700 [Pterospermum kingtungense]